jgi:tetratricopeptide (TPR) repeat protein
MGKFEGLEELCRFLLVCVRFFSHPHSLNDYYNILKWILPVMIAVGVLAYIWHCTGDSLIKALSPFKQVFVIAAAVILVVSIGYLLIVGNYGLLIFLLIVDLVAIGIYYEHRKSVQNFEQGNALLEQLNFGGAIACYNAAIKGNAEYGNAYYNRGVAKKEIGDSDGADKDFTKATKHGATLALDSTLSTLGSSLNMASVKNPPSTLPPIISKTVAAILVMSNGAICGAIAAYDLINRL